MSELTDLEICKRIAEIEGLENYISENKRHCMTRDKSSTRIIRHVEYNPLTDDALCFRLMVKYEVYIGCYDISGMEAFIDINRMEISVGETANKAICLAIIESKRVSHD